jgi:ADP-dependent NAD(P)H-hydrate dehydratase
MRPSLHAEVRLDEALLAGWPLPVDENGDKFSRGTVLVIGGSPTTPGAAILAGMAALRVGAGRLQIATASSIAPAVAVAVPEAMVLPLDVDRDGVLCGAAMPQLTELIGGAGAVLIGSGMVATPPPVEMVECVLRHATDDAVVVIDAAALSALGDVDAGVDGRLRDRLLLTPNRQEVDVLVARGHHETHGCTADDPLTIIAVELGASVTSFGTVQCADGRRWHTDVGHPSLGTSGSGDVLAGMAAGFAARTGDAAQSACWATFVHAATGERLGRCRGPLGFLARELIEQASATL